MERLMLFLRGLAVFLIAGAVSTITGMVLTALLPASSQVPGVLGLVAMVFTAWLLYPHVTGIPRRRNGKSEANADHQ